MGWQKRRWVSRFSIGFRSNSEIPPRILLYIRVILESGLGGKPPQARKIWVLVLEETGHGPVLLNVQPMMKGSLCPRTMSRDFLKSIWTQPDPNRRLPLFTIQAHRP